MSHVSYTVRSQSERPFLVHHPQRRYTVFLEKYHGPYLTKPVLIIGIVAMLRRAGVVAHKNWFEPIDRGVLFGAYMGLTEGHRTRWLTAFLEMHGVASPSHAEPPSPAERYSTRLYRPGTIWTFVEAADSFTRSHHCTGRTVGEAAMECARVLKLHPGSPDEAITMLELAGVRIPDHPRG